VGAREPSASDSATTAGLLGYDRSNKGRNRYTMADGSGRAPVRPPSSALKAPAQPITLEEMRPARPIRLPVVNHSPEDDAELDTRSVGALAIDCQGQPNGPFHSNGEFFGAKEPSARNPSCGDSSTMPRQHWAKEAKRKLDEQLQLQALPSAA
jgi:hypothetical protein